MFWLPGIIAAVGYLAATGAAPRRRTITRPATVDRAVEILPVDTSLDVPGEPASGGPLIVARDRHRVALGNLGVATVGALFSPPLLLASVGVALVQALPVLGLGIRALFKKGTIDSNVLSTVFLTIGVFSRAYWATAFASWFYHLCLYLRVKTEDHSSRRLVDVFTNLPREVWLVRDGVEISVPLSSLERGDVIAITAGSVIPVDGVVISGSAQVDQHVLSGESMIAEMEEGDQVSAATMVLAGKILVRTEETGKTTVASQVARALANTESYVASMELRGQQISDRAAAPTLAAAAASLLACGSQTAMSVMTADFGMGMLLLEPLAVLGYLDVAARKGILLKDGRSLQSLRTIDTIIFDKTGTLTHDRPKVERIHSWNGRTDDELLRLAASMEAHQSHPIALAILEYASARGIAYAGLDQTAIEIGYGLRSESDEGTLRIGSARFMEREGLSLDAPAAAVRDRCHGEGHSLILVAIDEEMIGGIELSPRVRGEASALVREYRNRGMRTYIVSGDHDAPTRQLATALGVDEYRAEMLPQDKARFVEQLQAEGRKVLFIGDGINDSIALRKANVSLSFLGASSLATESSQIILPDGHLEAMREVFRISHEFDRSMSQNLTLMLASTAVVLTGVFFMGMPFVGALMVTNLATAAGIVNAVVLPRRRLSD
jgi:heavy metal translocating P-type ATPase